MKWLYFKDKNAFSAGSVATIGNFDGVHRGHQALLTKLREQAESFGVPSLVVVFEPQPSEFLQTALAPVRLHRLREKLERLREYGVDGVLCLRFNNELSNMTPALFAKRIIAEQLHARYLLLGRDFRFGLQRKGDVAWLQSWATEQGISVEICPEFCVEDERVSSTRIRHALYLGDLKLVESLLGRRYCVFGRVQYGMGLGRQWGIPTANLNLPAGRLPMTGVFCVEVICLGKRWLGVANMGSRPTVDGTQNRLEVHLLDCDASLYGQRMDVFFVKKLRDERAFPSVDALIQQIQLDKTDALRFFNGF